MTNSTVPSALKVAAKRAFLRTTAQGYAASIPTALSVGALGDALSSPTKAIITVAIGVVSPLLAGAAAFFQMLANDIPDEYTPTVAK